MRNALARFCTTKRSNINAKSGRIGAKKGLRWGRAPGRTKSGAEFPRFAGSCLSCYGGKQISPAMTNVKSRQRLLLLCTTTGYQTQTFVEAAEKLGLTVIFATDRCHVLEDPWQDSALPLRFEDPEAGAQRIAEHAPTTPEAALVAIRDRPTPSAARACRARGLLSQPPEAAAACRGKYRSRH